MLRRLLHGLGYAIAHVLFVGADTPAAVVERLRFAYRLVGVRIVETPRVDSTERTVFLCPYRDLAASRFGAKWVCHDVLDRVDDGGDHERRALRDRLRAVDELLDEQWGEVNEIAPARKLHDRVGDLARETRDIDDELALVAQTYVGVCLLDAVEGIFETGANDVMVAA